MQRIRVIDSHTAGEPTRVIIEGGPDLGGGSLAERRTRFQQQFDRYRSAVVNEPRGSDVFVGALLVPPAEPSCAAGLIFFNNVGTLGMCGHGTIGVMTTLAYLGRLKTGQHRIETPVGVVTAELHELGDVSVHNVSSYRLAKNVAVDVDGYGRFRGEMNSASTSRLSKKAFHFAALTVPSRRSRCTILPRGPRR
jgi:Proline racemase